MPSMITGSPYMSKPWATTESARLQSMLSPGIDRQPSGPSWISSDRVSCGLTRCPSSPSTCQVNTRSPTPICGAARPEPRRLDHRVGQVLHQRAQLLVEVDDRRPRACAAPGRRRAGWA